MTPPSPNTIRQHLQAGGRLRLFLDYDGTLVPIAPTPDEALPDAPLLELLADLTQVPTFRVAILSGRPLSFLQTMLPVPGLILAGLYGVEIQIAGQEVTRGVAPTQARPMIEQVKSTWTQLVAGRSGFLVEDKGLAVALHARFADPVDADFVLSRAQIAARELLPLAGFRLLGGNRFLEVAPVMANKGQTVDWLLDQAPFPDALPVYFGDDDKDEEAFAVVRQRGGIPIAVGPPQRFTQAVDWAPSPAVVRRWLQEFLAEVL